MKSLFKNTLYLILFWFVVFTTNRIVFFTVNYLFLKEVTLDFLALTFIKSWRLDMSMIGYLMSIPLLLFFFSFLFPSKIVLKVVDYLVVVFIVIYNLAAFGETCLYLEWKSKLSMQALLHFAHPEEVFKTASWFLILLFFSLTIIFSIIYGCFFIKKLSFYKNVIYKEYKIIPKLTLSFLFLLTITGFSIISIRGGLQQIPIQTSDAYFCKVPIVNDATVNPLWNIGHNILDYNTKFKENPYKDFAQTEADFIAKSIVEINKDTTELFLTSKRPNIVYIILESWSADCIKSFNGDNFAPFVDSISRNGIRFTNFYSAGYVSDQGIPAILSGYPALSRMSVINLSTKSEKLPCISEDLKNLGYSSMFYFGGDLNYGNIRSYIYQKKFDIVKEEKDFDTEIPRGKLGIQDNYMNKEFLKGINNLKEPFLASWFTVSTHIPYDYEGKKEKLVEIENDYVNSLRFTDGCLKDFFKEAKKTNWYNNTLFVIVADHSHNSHKNYTNFEANYHRIPLFFYGNVIKNEYKGKEIKKVFSQLDITFSLLKQMGLDKTANQYVWSKNLFNASSKDLAYFCSFGGAGMVNNDGYISFQHGLNEFAFNTIPNKSSSDTLNRYAKAFQQSVFEDYRLK